MPWSMTDDDEPVEATGWWAEYALSSVGGIPSAQAFGTPFVANYQEVAPAGIVSAESVSAPLFTYLQSVAPTGIASLEAFGGSATSPGAIQVLPQHINSTEAVGDPAISVGPVFITPIGMIEYGMGVPTVSPGLVDVSFVGIPSAEVFGDALLTHIIAPNGILSEESFGPVLLSNIVAPTGISSSETFGSTNVAGGIQIIQPSGIASTEAFGGSSTDPGSVNVLPQHINSAESFGTVVITTGVVIVIPTGTISGEAFGTAQINQNVVTTGIVSAESVGGHKVNLGINGAGIASAEAFGTATVATGSAVPVSYINSASALATSVAIPAHQIGDIIVAFAYDNIGTSPTKPSAGGTVPTWNDIAVPSAANSNCCRTAYAVATATNHTTGTWTNADGIVVVVLRGQSSGSPIGGQATLSGSTNNSVTAPSVTLTRTDGTSQLLHFFGVRTVTSTLGSAPAGYTRRTTANSFGTPGVCCNTKNSTTSDGSTNTTHDGGAAGNYGATVEIRAY